MRKFLALAGLVAGLGACGGVDDRTEEASTLAQLRGVVSDPQGVGARNGLRLALVWYSQRPTAPLNIEDRVLFAASDELPISPSFPAGFTLSLTAPPPPEALNESMWVPGAEGGPDPVAWHEVAVRNAQGVIVLYEDRNGNGQLDLVDGDATEFVDDVVGMARRAQVTWLESEPPAELAPPGTQGQPAAGFNLLFTLEDVVRGNVYPGGYEFYFGIDEQQRTFDWRTPDEPLSVELDANPVLDSLMCGKNVLGCLDIIKQNARGSARD